MGVQRESGSATVPWECGSVLVIHVIGQSSRRMETFVVRGDKLLGVY